MFTPLHTVGLYAFSIYTILLLAAAVAAGALGVRVVIREEGSRISLWFFALCAITSCWLLGRGMSSAAIDVELAMAWTWMYYAALPFLPSGLLQFAYSAVGTERKPIALLIAAWTTSLIVAIVSLTTDQIIKGLRSYPWGFFPSYGKSGALFIAFTFLLGAVSVYVFGTAIRRLPPGRQRSRLKQFTAAFIVGFGATVDFFPAYGIEVIPFGPLAVLACILIIGSAIRRFQLFDITPAFAATNIVSTMRDGLIVADDEGRIRIVNDALCNLTGYARSELVGIETSVLLSVSASGDGVLRTRSGDAIPVNVSLSRLDDRARRRAGTVLIARDMREHRSIEAALREQEMLLRTEEVRRKAELQYRTLVESMAEGIIQVDRDKFVRYINDRASEMTGRPRETIIDRPIAELFSDEVLNSNEPHEVEFGPRWIEIAFSPIVDLTGETVGCIGVLTDITERRRFQQQLAASARDWQETFDAIQMPLVILDESGVVQHANRAAREYSDSGGLWKEIARLAQFAGQSERVQFEEPESGATWDIVVDVIDGDARERHVVVSARDITTLIDLQKMSTLGALVGGVAHEVRNPLFAISATLDAFEDVHGDRRELHGFLAILREQINRLSDLMSGLLELGRPPTAVMTRRMIGPIIEQAIALCADEARASGVHLSYDTVMEFSVSVDERRILQALRNVIHNAVQHSASGGKVHVCAHSRDDGRLLIRVIDDGPGFDPADLPHIFQPFFTRRTGGTGLGLSIARAVVEQHHGTVSAANRPERGAIISIELPAA